MLPRALRGSFVEEERSKNMLGLACECEMSVFHNESLSYIRDLKVMNDRRDFELASSDKNIEIRPEAVMFILVCSIAAFSLL